MLKITVLVATGLLLLLLFSAYLWISPKSDQQIVKSFKGEGYVPIISYLSFKGRPVRLIAMQKEIDPDLPVLLFVHGSPGSAIDFKRYLKSDELNAQANLVAYDRPGYGTESFKGVLPSLRDEVELLDSISNLFNISQLIVAGYSYGGTTVMASSRNFKHKVVIAGAVRAELEPLFWALNLTKWPLTRAVIPHALLNAADEKFRHIDELNNYNKQYTRSKSPVLAIHGKKDRIVPYQNSLFLESIIDRDKFSLLSLEKGNHSLLWTNFELIHNELIKLINK